MDRERAEFGPCSQATTNTGQLFTGQSDEKKGINSLSLKSHGEVDICQKWAAATELPVSMLLIRIFVVL